MNLFNIEDEVCYLAFDRKLNEKKIIKKNNKKKNKTRTQTG
jgi:hypothetical protein